MLFSVIAWKAEPNWDFKTWVFLLVFCLSISAVVAFFSALASWNWKK
jgi:hypothetical protein